MPTATTSDGVKIYYQDMGQGEPALLLMAAWCMSHSVYRHLLPKCAAHRRTIALDWRGHGQSETPKADFGAEGLVQDALAVIEASGAQQIIPVSASHSGWITVELRRLLGDRIPKIINTDWVVLPPPPPYMDLVHALAAPESWEQARDTLFSIWLEGVENPEVISFVRDEMGGYGADTWLRSGREIGSNYETGGYPLKALSSMSPSIPVLHIYSQPPDLGYLQAQQDFAAQNPWFNVYKLDAHSHFPTLEVADEIANAIEKFVTT
jgi:pimeloyl-ACP methyl ester carboxylesterase